MILSYYLNLDQSAEIGTITNVGQSPWLATITDST